MKPVFASQIDLKKRLTRVEEELKYTRKFDFIIVNDDLEIALNEAKQIVASILGN